MWIYTACAYTILFSISLFRIFVSLMVVSCVTSCSPLVPPPYTHISPLPSPFASQTISSALPTFPFLSYSYYNSSPPLPPFLHPSLQICSSLHSVTNDQNSTLIINTTKAKCCTRACLCQGMSLFFELQSLSHSTHSNYWYR